MSNNLYEILGLHKTATAEEIRKAYRKKALLTHPDRLPQGTTPEDRETANEQFRLVNNAYEVLTDENNRMLYDQFGVWPPPAPTPDPRPTGSSSRHPRAAPFPSPFGFPESHPRFTHDYIFRDPFELFNSLFDDNFFGSVPRHPAAAPAHPFGFGSGFGGGFPMSSFSPFGGMGGLMTMGFGGPSGGATHMQGLGGQWVSQSMSMCTVNGRTESIMKQVDAQGNEHVTISSPEGERYTINGVEQPRGAGTPSAVTYHADSGAEAGRRAHVNPPRAFSYSSTDQRGPVIPSRQYTEPPRGGASHQQQRYHDVHARQPYEDHRPRRSGETHSTPPAGPPYANRPAEDRAWYTNAYASGNVNNAYTSGSLNNAYTRGSSNNASHAAPHARNRTGSGAGTGSGSGWS